MRGSKKKISSGVRGIFFFFDGGDVRGPFSVTVLFKNLRNLHLIVVSAAPPPPGLLDFRMVLTLPRSHISRASVIISHVRAFPA